MVLIGLLNILYNYQSASELLVDKYRDHANSFLKLVDLSELEGFDYGYIHSQKAEFNMLYLTLK